jgi:hypothetical protein
MTPKDETETESSLQAAWEGFSQSHQEHTGWDYAGREAQGQGLDVGAGKERLLKD